MPGMNATLYLVLKSHLATLAEKGIDTSALLGILERYKPTEEESK